MDKFLLPLFPLDLVLFPDEVLPLHIFEERFKQMIGECLAKDEFEPDGGEFGVVCMRARQAERVGCTARITRVIRRYEDGRLDILTSGRRRFEILFTNDEQPYLRAAVSFVEDHEAELACETEKPRARQLFHEVLKRLEISGGIPDLDRESRRPSFQIAAALPLGLEFKQEVLALRSERERLRRLSDLMEKLVPALDERARARTRSSGNGHAGRSQ
ncbi:MAG TPA: LON peptidase substrate-binding domain-containing protein [Terriglobia bacterium]|nr:LON peptidase substrate-binding domain-containing protein [Terriglobia bacterium]